VLLRASFRSACGPRDGTGSDEASLGHVSGAFGAMPGHRAAGPLENFSAKLKQVAELRFVLVRRRVASKVVSRPSESDPESPVAVLFPWRGFSFAGSVRTTTPHFAIHGLTWARNAVQPDGASPDQRPFIRDRGNCAFRRFEAKQALR
jgi:hypothetical protein